MQQGELHEIESHVKVGHDAAAVWKSKKMLHKTIFVSCKTSFIAWLKRTPCLRLLQISFQIHATYEIFFHFFWLCNNLHHDIFSHFMKVKVILSFSSPCIVVVWLMISCLPLGKTFEVNYKTKINALELISS